MIRMTCFYKRVPKIISAGLFCMFGSLLSAQTAEEWYNKAISSENYQNYELQITFYTKAIELGFKPLTQAYYGRSISKFYLKKYDSAILDCNEVIKQDSFFVEAYSGRAAIKAALRQYSAAIIDYDTAIQLQPNLPQAYVDRANIKSNYLKQYQSALLDLDKAIELQPEFPAAYYRRGLIKTAFLGQYTAALSDYDMAIELGSRYYDAGIYFNARGLLKYNLGQYASSILDFDKAIEFKEDPNFHQFYYNRSKAYDKLGNCEKALADCEKSLENVEKKFTEVNAHRAQLIAKCKAADKTPPTLILVEPLAKERQIGVGPLNTDSCTVRGRVNDASGIRLVLVNQVRVYVDTDGTFSIKVATPDNTITIRVTDNKDNFIERVVQLSEPKSSQSASTVLEKRLALIMANTQYLGLDSLGRCPSNDADDMEIALKRLGFEVILHKDANLSRFRAIVNEFTERLKKYDTGLFYYAGHGLGINGINYLVPIDFPKKATQADVYNACIDLSWLQNKMGEAGDEGKTNIVIVDACRNDGGLRNLRNGSPTWEPTKNIPTGFVTCYAVPNGEAALNCNGRNGFYTSILLQYIETPNLLIQQVFTRVRTEVLKQGGKRSEESDQLTKDVYLSPKRN